MEAPLLYGSINPPVAVRVPLAARRVLDVGCGDGTLGRHLRDRQGARVTGITWSEAEAARARDGLEQVVVADLDAWEPVPGLGPFEAVVCSHVLEHLRDAGRLLRVLRGLVTPSGVLVVALPNVLFWRQRWEFLRGRFRYGRGGLMDTTHLRFYDGATARELVAGNGWEVTEVAADGGFPGSRFTGLARPMLDRWAVRWRPGLFGFQLVIAARPGLTFSPEMVRHP